MGPGFRRDDSNLERVVTQPLLIEHHDGVDRVTLNRPDSLNALDPDLIDALNVYFQGLQRNRDTRIVVLKGAGASFCAGLDLKQAMKRRAGQQEPPGVTESLDSQRRIADIVMLMRRCPQPIIALIQGAAAGGGFALALASDIRIATKNARMNCAFIKLGLGGCDIGTSYFLPRLVGVSVASELILTGRLSAPSARLPSGWSRSWWKIPPRSMPRLNPMSMRCWRRRRSACGSPRNASTWPSMPARSKPSSPWKIATRSCAAVPKISAKASGPSSKSESLSISGR